MDHESFPPAEPSDQASAGTPATSSAVVIRAAKARDVRAIAAIQRQSFPPRLAYGTVALLTLLFWPGVCFLVARDQQTHRIVGNGIADRYKGNARVMNLAIDPAWRRRGVGRELLRALGEAMPEGDITLMVQEHNSGAQALYASEGFVRTGLARDYYGAGQHGIAMRKARHPETTPGTISI